MDLVARIKNIFRAAIVTRPERNALADFPVHQIEYMSKEADGVAHYPYGIHANPGKGTFCYLMLLASNGEAKVIFPDSSDSRPQLAESENCIFHPASGSILKFAADGSISIKSAIGAKITVPLLEVIGSESISGDLDQDGPNVGLRGSTPVPKPVVTGDKATQLSTVVANLLAALELQGIIDDSTT